MADNPTLEQLSDRLAVSRDRIQAWEALGLIRRADDGGFDADATERARLLRFAEDRGISAEEVARLSREEGDILGRSITFLGGARPAGYSLREAAER